MTEQEIIKKLKDNEAHRIFADMSKEEQAILNKLYSKKNVQFLSNSMMWELVAGYGTCCKNTIYRIAPDYQPEPEYVDLEIVRHTEGIEQIWWLGVWKCNGGKRYDFLPWGFTHLHVLPSLPNFEGFYINKYPDWTPAEYQRISHRIEVEKKTVFARLRR